jgi:hypothetical protein
MDENSVGLQLNFLIKFNQVICHSSVAFLSIFPSRYFTPVKSQNALDDFVIMAWLAPSFEGQQYLDCHVG